MATEKAVELFANAAQRETQRCCCGNKDVPTGFWTLRLLPEAMKAWQTWYRQATWVEEIETWGVFVTALLFGSGMLLNIVYVYRFSTRVFVGLWIALGFFILLTASGLVIDKTIRSAKFVLKHLSPATLQKMERREEEAWRNMAEALTRAGVPAEEAVDVIKSHRYFLKTADPS